MSDEIRITLSEADFALLVQGKIVEKKEPSGQTVKIALSDIGYDRIMYQVKKAMSF
jgi:hypothetical protein